MAGNWYKEKMKEHYELWEEAISNERTSTAEFHMREYLNYEEMYKRVNEGEDEGCEGGACKI